MGLDLPGVALITGAGGSIGRACVLQFALDGCTRIIGLDISTPGLASTASALQTLPTPPTRTPVDFLPLVVNQASEDEVTTAIATAVEKFGRIDYLVNNAAIAAPFAPTAASQTSDFDRVLGVNLRGLWFCQRAVLRVMETQAPLAPSAPWRVPTRGSIVELCSILGLVAMPEDGLYTISKHGVMGLVKTDALDYGKKGIRVNAVCPGFVDTPLLTAEYRVLLDWNIKKNPMGRLALPGEIADAVVWLASERSSYVTGTSVVVDGGYCTS